MPPSSYSDQDHRRGVAPWDDGADEPPPLDVLGALRRRKRLILGVFLASLGVAVLYLLFAKPRYDASAALLLDSHLGRPAATDSIPDPADVMAVDSQVQVLTSQSVLARLVKAENLDSDPAFAARAPNPIARLLGLSAAPAASFDYVGLAKAFTIKKADRSYVIDIQASAGNPVQAAALANGLAQAYIDDQIDARVKKAQDDSRWTHEKLDELAREISETDSRIEAFKQSHHVVDTDGLRSGEAQVADAVKENSATRARVLAAQGKIDQIERALRAQRVDATDVALNSATIERLRSQQTDVEMRVAALSETLGERHPALLEARAQQTRVKHLVVEELRRIRLAAEDELAAARMQESQVESVVSQLKSQSSLESSANAPLRAMTQKLTALRASYDKLARVRDSLIEAQANTPPARIIAVARPPVLPKWPKAIVVLPIAAAAGLFLGVAAALGLENLKPRRDGSPTDEDDPFGERHDEDLHETRRRRGSPRPPRRSRRFWSDDPQPDGGLNG